MAGNKKAASVAKPGKVQTGINGLDEITDGGLPKDRITIISGNAGCGKTIMSMEFLVNGAARFDEKGVFISFEETSEELTSNMEALNFDIKNLVSQKKIYLEYLEIDKSQFVEAGKYDLEGLFVRLQHAINNIGAKRVVLDSLDALFYGLETKVLRQEIKRLFKWLKDNKINAIITSEIDNGFIAKYTSKSMWPIALLFWITGC
jgi:circadian clock protein KaiC